MPTRNGWRHHSSASTGVDVSDQSLLPESSRKWCWVTWSRKDTLLCPGDQLQRDRANGELASQLQASIARLPQFDPVRPEVESRGPPPVAPFIPPPLERHIAEGSFFIHDDRSLMPDRKRPGYSRRLWRHVAHGRRHHDRQATRRPGRLTRPSPAACSSRRTTVGPKPTAPTARRALNHAYDLFALHYGPINKTTFSETADGTMTRRMPNLAKFRKIRTPCW